MKKALLALGMLAVPEITLACFRDPKETIAYAVLKIALFLLLIVVSIIIIKIIKNKKLYRGRLYL